MDFLVKNLPMDELCPKCGDKISLWKGSATINTGSGPEKICASCYKSHWALTYQEPRARQNPPAGKVSSKSSSVSSSDGLIAAQNRTTHAVRALAITFVAAPVIALVVIAAGVVAINSGNSTIIVVVGFGG